MWSVRWCRCWKALEGGEVQGGRAGKISCGEEKPEEGGGTLRVSTREASLVSSGDWASSQSTQGPPWMLQGSLPVGPLALL